jgi:hypothetical protein
VFCTIREALGELSNKISLKQCYLSLKSQIAGTLLIEPVERHMKKVEVEVEENEKLQLLNDKHRDIVIRKDSNTLREVKKELTRRATEPNVANQNGNENNKSNKSESHHNIYSSTNGNNGRFLKV